jgi:ribosome-binding factor A
MSTRQERFSRMVQEELSLLVDDLADPRVAETLFSITAVQVAPDLGSAKVYVTVAGGDAKAEKQLLAGLASAAPYLRRQLARAVQSKKACELHFYIDEAKERGDRVEQILRELAAEKPAAASSSAPEPADAPVKPEKDSS